MKENLSAQNNYTKDEIQRIDDNFLEMRKYLYNFTREYASIDLYCIRSNKGTLKDTKIANSREQKIIS